MLQTIIRQFHFTRAERHGALALLLLCSACFMAPAVYRLIFRAEPVPVSAFANAIAQLQAKNRANGQIPDTASLFPFDPNTASFETFLQLGLTEKVAKTIVKYRERGGRFRTAEALQKIYTLSEADFNRLKPYIQIGATVQSRHKTWEPEPVVNFQLLPFDPNTASEEELLRLGLPKTLVARMLRYRENGGRFREKPDFGKLYGLKAADYQRLEPYITIAQSTRAIRPAAYAGGTGSVARYQELDINTAPTEAWQQLPGIGPVRAQQIVRFRDKLGGFISPEQVGETRGLPDSVFQKIRQHLNLKTPVFRKLNLNVATTAEFSAHPYFTFQQGQLIVRYREQHGPFSSIRDLEKIAAFTDKAWLERITAYVYIANE